MEGRGLALDGDPAEGVARNRNIYRWSEMGTQAARSRRLRERSRTRGDRIVRSRISGEIVSIIDEAAREVGLDRGAFIAHVLALTAEGPLRFIASVRTNTAANRRHTSNPEPHGDV